MVVDTLRRPMTDGAASDRLPALRSNVACRKERASPRALRPYPVNPWSISSVVALVLVALVLAATTMGPAKAAGRQVALVIGNAAYEQVSPLKNPKQDAAAFSDRLRDAGFDVVEVFDGDLFTMRRAADRFVESAKGADLALFYFAGHGVQLFDRNYLLARDTDPEALQRIDDLGLSLTDLAGRLRASGAVRVALLVDACRDNPLPLDTTVKLVTGLQDSTPTNEADARQIAARAFSRGLAPLGVPSGNGGAEMLTFFAAQPAEVSYDGTGANSFLMEGLLEALSGQERDMAAVIRHASAYVRTVTQGKQVPQVVSDWTGDVALGGNVQARVVYDFFDRETKLSEADKALIRKGTGGFTKLRGDFIALASWNQGEPYYLSDEEKKQYFELGGNALSMNLHYDLDRDGRDEAITVYNEKFSVQVVVTKEGVRATIGNCSLPAAISAIEIGLRDVDGDRRPEVFLSYQGDQLEGFGKFCVLRFKGFGKLPELRRANLGRIDGKELLFDTLLDIDAGWSVTVGTDGSLRRCSGTGCPDSWTYAFDGRQYVAADDETPPNTLASAGGLELHRSSAPVVSRAEQVATFVESTLFRPGPRQQAELRALYGNSVDYFGKRGMAVKDVLKDKVQYFKRWPERDFRLDRSTMSVTTDGQELSIQFEYSYDVSGQKGRRSGRGVSMMRLREAANGSFVILSENGRTL